MRKLNLKQSLILVLLLFSVGQLIGQESKFIVNYEVSPQLSNLTKDGKLYFYFIFQSKNNYRNSVNTGFELKKNTKNGILEVTLEDDTYEVEINCAFYPFEENPNYSQNRIPLFYIAIDSITIPYKNNKLYNIQLKNECPYTQNPTKMHCPKCKSRKYTIKLCHGLYIIDPITGETHLNDCHEPKVNYGCELPTCGPRWYCKKDDIEY